MSAQSIYQTYLAYVGRPPDQSGLDFYANASLASAAADISASSEASALFLGRNSDSLEEQVNEVYTHLFGRRADSEGASYWVGELQAGRLSSDQLAIAVLNGAQNEDALIIANKLEV